MKKHILLLFIISISFAQQKWIRAYGGTDYDWGYSVQQTNDGEYIITGNTNSFGPGSPGNLNAYLVKTDSTGDTLWTRAYGGLYEDESYSVRQTSDGGYIIVGMTSSFGPGTPDIPNVYLVKTDSNGDTLWTKTYGGNTTGEGANSIQQTGDGGYIMAGGSAFEYDGDVYLIKTDSLGDTLWTRTYGGTGYDEGFSVQVTSDGGYIVAGIFDYRVGNPPYSDIYLIKTSASGDTLWTRRYIENNYNYGNFVQQTSDGGYIVVGLTRFGAGNDDVYIIKTDTSGYTLWTMTYGGGASDEGWSVQQTPDGGYIICGSTLSFGAGGWDVYTIKTDSLGGTIWTMTHGGINDDGGKAIQQTGDGGYIITGWTRSFGAGFTDVFLIKTDVNGNEITDESISHEQSLGIILKVEPNPFTSFARIPGYEKEDFALADITGRVIGKYQGAKLGENLPAGVYFIIPQNKNLKSVRIVKVR